jgi:hypothetical protein
MNLRSRGSEERMQPNVMAAAMEPSFQMYIMDAAVLLSLEKLETHQSLLRRGMVRVFNPKTDLFVVFGSHRWTSDTEPDHSGASSAHCRERSGGWSPAI